MKDTMLSVDQIVEQLNYTRSPYYRRSIGDFEPETAHLFRAAKQIGADGTVDGHVDGVYVFQTGSGVEPTIRAAKPAVFVATADSEGDAREIHRRFWNLSYAPFIIVQLPHQIRVYTGFAFSSEAQTKGLLGEIEVDQLNRIPELLSGLSAEAIDSGHIWESQYGRQLDPNQRVDHSLLKNLQQLGKTLTEHGLKEATAHALIGKYVYIRYLRDRQILTNTWLAQHGLEPDDIFSQNATIDSLQKLVVALENRFNGRIFPINFAEERNETLKDQHVSWVASVFRGSKIIASVPDVVQQLHLSFEAYDFRYIPVETLSSIYEQFIDKRKEKGAIYTPEFLADYLLSEVEWAKPLELEGKILDPACGSGVFLVLAYRRLVEKELFRLGRRLTPEELKAILVKCIYGVERERDACYVAEFSLILTLLHYVEPPDLDKLDFKFPVLHNSQIFEADFFDLLGQESDGQFWQQGFKFDWIVGNPPWTSDLHPQEDKFALEWIKNSKRPVSGQRIAEAFSWLVTDLLKADGIVGLLLPATSLYNLNSKKYRQTFFTKHDVLRITNFANLRDVLFGRGKNSVLPAATIIYRPSIDSNNRPDIVHYGPFAVNQIVRSRRRPWTITINENEIQTVSVHEAESGQIAPWKYALWGSYLDRDAIERIEFMFPLTLLELCRRHKLVFQQGSEVKDVTTKSSDTLEHVSWLKDKKLFDTNMKRYSPLRFSIEPLVLKDIPDEMCYIRLQGGKKGLDTTWAPHIVISPAWGQYITYSEVDFVLPPRQIGIAAPKHSSVHLQNILRALSIYLNSSLVAYYLFFRSPQWGVFMQARRVSTTEVGKIRTPEFTREQVDKLASFHIELVKREREEISRLIDALPDRQQRVLDFHKTVPNNTDNVRLWTRLTNLSNRERRQLTSNVSLFHSKIQQEIDNTIFELCQVPDDIQLLVREFINIRLPLDKASPSRILGKPSKHDLLAYARQLQEELDGFGMNTVFHKVTLTSSNELIECIVEIINSRTPIPIDEKSITSGDMTRTKLLSELSENLQEQFSQWVYVQRGLRLFDGPRTYIYKSPRLIDWTRTQAMRDAGDLIGQVIAKSMEA